MENPAPVAYPIHELLVRRWSARAIDPAKPVPRATVLSLLEAARWTPSSSNEQPWRFLVFDESNPEAREKARGILGGNNKLWAVNAPVMFLSVASETWARNGSPNRHAGHDVGAAAVCLMLEAVSRGLVAHEMGGYEADKARELFAIPAGFTPMAMIAVGHPAPVETLPDPLKERETLPRVRKPLGEIAFAGTWAAPFKES